MSEVVVAEEQSQDTELKTNAIRKLEAKLENIDGDGMRTFLLQSAKNFKTSWIELGRALFAVKKDKLYYDWGFETFESYANKEVGIKKQTAVKLIKSYQFLEKEETWYLKQETRAEEPVASTPDYESVNVLRLAKQRKDIEENDYQTLKKSVFEEGKDHKELRKDLTQLIKQKEDISPEDARMQERLKTIKRFISTMKSTRETLSSLKMLPDEVLVDADKVIERIEEYI